MAQNLFSNKENHLLNALRFVAALLVVAGHIRTTFYQDYSQETHGLMKASIFALTSLGSPAVLVFFTLSGYWVGGGALKKIEQGRFSFWDYLLRRLVRLWIVLIPALLMTLAVDAFGMLTFPGSDIYANPDAYTGVRTPISHSLLTFFGNIVFMQSLVVPEFGYDHPLWSLSYEFWYYVAFPCALMLFVPRQSMIARAGWLSGFALAAIVGSVELLYLAPSWLFGAIAGRFPHLFDGLRQRLSSRRWDLCQFASLLVLLAAMCVVRSAGSSVGMKSALGLVTALCLLVMARDLGHPIAFITSLSKLSHCTFSLYTSHMPLVALSGAILVPSAASKWSLVSEQGIYLIIVLLALLGFAWVLALFTERKTDVVHSWIVKTIVNARLSFGKGARPA